MASPAINPSPPSAAGTMNQFSASMVNSFRVAAVLERLSLHLVFNDPAGPQHPHGVEYYNLLLSLARGIDFAVANNDIPDKIERMPELLKQICHRKSDAWSQALVMVLMISVKNACKAGWFSEKEKQELFGLIDDVGTCFYNPRDINSGTSCSLSAISTIFSRYYPQLKMGEILTSLEVKPGYGAFVSDFHISKNASHSPEEKIRLFVAQRDNMESSACIISPPQVNFLLNGKGVERRTNVFVDAGPQMPTNVTSMLKYGTNLLQAVGQFNGHYIIAIAFMGMAPTVDSTGLKDYISPTVSAPDSDSDLIEGPSRISLNCPISRSRIQVPVKGQSCKHPQCFDFRNFVGINSRRPSWRCPHCNQSVCYTDLRIDQNIAKVLKEVGSDITNVMISDDGSWKAIMESDDDIDITNKVSTIPEEAPERQGSANPPPISNVLDLTGDDDEMDAVTNMEDEDRKPPLVNRDLLQQENNLRSCIYEMATTANPGSDTQVTGDEPFEPTMLSNLTSPAITDSVCPVRNSQEIHGLGSTSSVDSLVQSQLSAANSLQLQQPQLVTPISSNEYGYGNRQTIPVNVSRTPIAVQALPVQRQTPNLLQNSSNIMNSTIRNNSSMASPIVLPQSQQEFSRSHPTTPLSSFPQTTATQARPHSPAQLVQQALNRPASPAQQQRPTQLHSPRGVSTGLFAGFQNQHLQKALNNSMPPPRNQSPTTPRFPLPRAQTPPVPTPALSGVPHSRFSIPTQQPNPSPRQHVPPQIGISRPPGIRAPSPSEEQRRKNTAGVQTSPSGEGSGDLASENWQPAGRMRGSLTGRPFTDEISHLVIRPTQPSRPGGQPAPSNPVSSFLSAPPHLRSSLPNSRNTNTGNTQNNQ